MILISEENLKLLIENSFSKGVLSYNVWKGQPDTLWSNVEDDKKEYVDARMKEVLKELKFKINSNNE